MAADVAELTEISIMIPDGNSSTFTESDGDVVKLIATATLGTANEEEYGAAQTQVAGTKRNAPSFKSMSSMFDGCLSLTTIYLTRIRPMPALIRQTRRATSQQSLNHTKPILTGGLLRETAFLLQVISFCFLPRPQSGRFPVCQLTYYT